MTHEDIEKKARAILEQMTLEEKIGQLSLKGYGNFDAEGIPQCTDLKELIKKGLVGTVHRRPNDPFEVTEELQRMAMEETRCKIPLLFSADMIHACETVFPIPLAASCSFDTELVEKAAKAMADEAHVCGTNYTFAPMVDVSRDARWGRIAESQGEDPYLAGEMGKAYVRGFQNEETYVMSTMKHYAAYSACEGGRDYDTAEVCENTMLNTYLIPFREGVSAGADSVMSSFNCIENIPATGNKKYLRDILRGKFGFDGIVVSDAISVKEMHTFGYCETLKDCAYRALKAGLDIELGSRTYMQELPTLLEEGAITEADIDEAVLRVLCKKIQLGLFDDPYKCFRGDKSVIFSEEHLQLSEDLACESAVLLENNGVLPMNTKTKVALIGDFGDNKDLFGCWQHSTKLDATVPLKEGLLKQGFEIVGESGNFNIMEAEAASFGADVVVFAFGESNEESGEASSKHNLEVREEIKHCFEYLKARGKKVVTIVFAGRPLIVNAFKYSDALIFGWHLGHRTGTAIAKLLAGERNFSGKLTVTVPRTEKQLPIYYSRRRAGRPFDENRPDYRFQARYNDGENFPQYPFGYGLSYSHFEYGDVQVENTEMKRGESLNAWVNVTNTSDTDGWEIVQMYIKDCYSETIRPVRELKGFHRVYIKAGETVKVNFEITERELGYYHADGVWGTDDGSFVVTIGPDSTSQNSCDFVLKS